MTLDTATLLALVLFGGVVALDATAVGQFMLSRPFVAATTGGWLAGDPEAGAVLGLILEALHLRVLPVGAARYPEPGPAAVAAGAAYAASSSTHVVLLGAVLCAVAWETFSGWTVQRLRHFNMRSALEVGSTRAGEVHLSRSHVGSMAVDFARGSALTALGMAAFFPVLNILTAVPDRGASRLAVATAAAAALAGASRLFGTGRMRLFAVGAAGGAVLLWLR